MSPTDMRNFLLKTRKVRASSTNWRWAVGNINTGSYDEIVASALPKEFERNFSGPIEDSVKCSYNRRYYYRPTLNLESGGIDCIVLSFNVYAVVDVKVDFDPNITLHIGRRTILLAEEAITLGRSAFVIGPEELRGTGVSLKKIPICLIRGLCAGKVELGEEYNLKDASSSRLSYSVNGYNNAVVLSKEMIDVLGSYKEKGGFEAFITHFKDNGGVDEFLCNLILKRSEVSSNVRL